MEAINKIKVSQIPHLKLRKGMFIESHITVDVLVSLVNVQKITDIESDGTLRIQCINPKCKKINCTYLNLFKDEIPKLRINNNVKKSGRLSLNMIG
jgi:hypothetical protein